jgi:regulation of enolase protein 1 (concanavalin A-like superfamily)/ribosomal protein S18 acetylase RimI-like enzyme
MPPAAIPAATPQPAGRAETATPRNTPSGAPPTPFVRPYAPSDRDTLRDICVRTGLEGGDSRHLYPDPDLLPSVFAAPYAELESGLAFVLDDGRGRAVGYVLGTADTEAFVRAFRHDWLPRVGDRHPRPAGTPGTPSEEIAELLHTPERMLLPELAGHPAHLHIDLLPEWQRKGYGRTLMQALLRALRARGAGAVHLSMVTSNTAARAFYDRLGFEVLPVPDPGPLTYLGRSTEVDEDATEGPATGAAGSGTVFGLTGWSWCNPPSEWTASDGFLDVTTDPDTDFWVRTHYGFVRDTGHALLRPVPAAFRLRATFAGGYRDQYDQAGLLLRMDATNWIKAGIEFVDGRRQVSAVVTRGMSDWSVSPLDGPATGPVTVEFERAGDTVTVRYADGAATPSTLLRLAYFPEGGGATAGPMCASPDGAGFTTRFSDLRLANSTTPGDV